MTLNSEQMERTDSRNLQYRKVSSGRRAVNDRDPELKVKTDMIVLALESHRVDPRSWVHDR